LTNAFYSIKGLELLGEKLNAQTQQDICTFVKSKVDKTNLESIYYATSLAALIPNCALPVADFTAALTAGAASTKVPELYYYAFTAQTLKQTIDAKKLAKSVTDALKADSSIVNQGYSLHIATLLGENSKVFYDSIEDILDQADEVDKKYLQYEGGVGTTSLVLEGIFLLSERTKQLPAKFDQARLIKFVNYLTSKRFPTNIKSAYFLLRVSRKLSDNQFAVPLVLNRLSSISVSAAQPNALISVTNILGNAVTQTQLTVEATSAKSQKNTLLAAKRPFVAKSSDGSTYEIKLIDSASQSLAADFYQVVVSVTPKQAGEKRFFLVQTSFEVKVATVISVTDVNVGVADRDQSTPKLAKVEEGAKLKDRLEADQQSKLYVKFNLKDKARNTPIEAQQTFVRFAHSKTGREIIFLAQSGLNNQYTAEIDFSTNAKNFQQNSGVYTVELIISDALVENPIKWQLAEINVNFSADQTASSQTDKSTLYSKRAEIKHLFREPETTPPAAVSSVFALLCLAPLCLLLSLWVAIGVNFSKFSFTLSGLIFHIALAAIFGLFYLYWVKLNMFETSRYLLVLGVVAYLSGNKLLKYLASLNKEKKN